MHTEKKGEREDKKGQRETGVTKNEETKRIQEWQTADIRGKKRTHYTRKREAERATRKGKGG